MCNSKITIILSRSKCQRLSSFYIEGVVASINKKNLSSSKTSILYAPGINLRFMGVSSVTGRMATVTQPSGNPAASGFAKDLVNWCTAALAMP